MKHICTAILFFFFFSASYAQQVPALLSIKGYGGNNSEGVSTKTVTDDGGCILGMGTMSDIGTGNIDTFCAMGSIRSIFLKYSGSGTLEWFKCIQDDGDTSLAYMYPNNDGGAIFGGEFFSGYGWGFYISKQDANGNLVWGKAYSKGKSTLLRDMTETRDGGYIMAGQVYYTDTNATIHHGDWTVDDIWVLKLDSSGNKVWSTVIGGTDYDYVKSVVEAPEKGCYVVGSTRSNDYDCAGNHGSIDMYVARLDSQGNIMWHRDLGGSGDEFNGYACSNGNGGVIIAGVGGSPDGDLNHYVQGLMYWVIDLDSSNNIKWENCYGGGGHEEANAICRGNDGSIWVTGFSKYKGGQVDSAYGDDDIYVVHLDSAGVYLSSLVLGSSDYDIGSVISPLANNFVLCAGEYSKDNGNLSMLPQFGGFSTTDALIAEFAPWTTGIREIARESKILIIYPNPTLDKVAIKNRSNNNIGIQISNVFGQTVYTGIIHDENEIKVSDWNTGVYFVHAVDERGNWETAKLIVQ